MTLSPSGINKSILDQGMELCIQQAKLGRNEGGIPIGCVIVSSTGEVLAAVWERKNLWTLQLYLLHMLHSRSSVCHSFLCQLLSMKIKKDAHKATRIKHTEVEKANSMPLQYNVYISNVSPCAGSQFYHRRCCLLYEIMSRIYRAIISGCSRGPG